MRQPNWSPFLFLLLLVITCMIPSTTSVPSSIAVAEEEEEATPSSPSTSLRDLIARQLRQKSKFDPRHPPTCDVYPKICKSPGSPGKDCCKKRCVNHKTDVFNCGKCGHKCKFGQKCCKGKCKSVLSDKNNCGWCHNKCKKGNKCRYGMCSYA